MSFIPPPPNRDDIDFGTTPDRTTKIITMRIMESTGAKDTAVGRTVKTFTSIIDVHIWVRDVSMRGNRREPQELIDMEKYVKEYVALNRLNFIDQGIQNVQLKSVRSGIDEDYSKYGVWYHTVVTLEAHYSLFKT